MVGGSPQCAILVLHADFAPGLFRHGGTQLVTVICDRPFRALTLGPITWFHLRARTRCGLQKRREEETLLFAGEFLWFEDIVSQNERMMRALP